jgi:hypothetical protein
MTTYICPRGHIISENTEEQSTGFDWIRKTVDKLGGKMPFTLATGVTIYCEKCARRYFLNECMQAPES